MTQSEDRQPRERINSELCRAILANHYVWLLFIPVDVSEKHNNDGSYNITRHTFITVQEQAIHSLSAIKVILRAAVSFGM